MLFDISGPRIREIRKGLGDTQQQFAARLKVSRVDRWERDETSPQGRAVREKLKKWDLELSRKTL